MPARRGAARRGPCPSLAATIDHLISSNTDDPRLPNSVHAVRQAPRLAVVAPSLILRAPVPRTHHDIRPGTPHGGALAVVVFSGAQHHVSPTIGWHEALPGL